MNMSRRRSECSHSCRRRVRRPRPGPKGLPACPSRRRSCSRSRSSRRRRHRSRNRCRRPNAIPANQSSVPNAATVGAPRANSPSPYLNAGCARRSAYVRRTPSSITLRVCAVSRDCSIIAPNRTVGLLVRTILVLVVLIAGRLDGAAWRPLAVCCPVFGSIGLCSAERGRWRPAMLGTRGRAASVDPRTRHTSTPPRNVCSTQVQTSKRKVLKRTNYSIAEANIHYINLFFSFIICKYGVV